MEKAPVGVLLKVTGLFVTGVPACASPAALEAALRSAFPGECCGDVRVSLVPRRGGFGAQMAAVRITNSACADRLKERAVRLGPPFERCSFHADKKFKDEKFGRILWPCRRMDWACLLSERSYALQREQCEVESLYMDFEKRALVWKCKRLQFLLPVKCITNAQASFWFGEGGALLHLAIPFFRAPKATRLALETAVIGSTELLSFFAMCVPGDQDESVQPEDKQDQREPPGDLQHTDMALFTFDKPEHFRDIIQCLGSLRLVQQELELRDAATTGVDFEQDRQLVYDVVCNLPYTFRWKLAELLSHNVVAPAGPDAVEFFMHVLGESNGPSSRQLLLALMHLSSCYLDVSRLKGRGPAHKALTHHKALRPLEALKRCSALALDDVTLPLELPLADSNWCRVVTLVVTPSKVYCYGPYIQQSNRMLRHYKNDSDCFVRVHFADETLAPVWSSRDLSAEPIFSHYLAVLGGEGLLLLGRRYEFVMYSQSQLRERACWFLEAASSVTALSANAVRLWMSGGTAEPAQQIRSVAKFAARLGLNLTTTDATTFTPQFLRRPDIIRNDKCFSDGCGIISPTLMRRLFEGKSQFPSAIQIRFRGFKGMLVAMHGSCTDVEFTNSMFKYEGCDSHLEVCRTSKRLPAFINRQIILLLSGLGVPVEYFADVQDQFLELIDAAHADSEAARRFLRCYGGAAFSHWWHGAFLALTVDQRFGCTRGARDLLGCVLAETLDVALRLQIVYLEKKTRLPLGKNAAKVFGVCDFTGALQEDEVFVQLSDESGCPHTVESQVLVYREPSLHCGDIRRLRAVGPEHAPGLSHLRDVIVFPTAAGARPLPDSMSGGDLDGDEYTVVWDPQLLAFTGGHDVPPLDYVPLQPITLQPEVHIGASHLADNFVNNMRNSDLGVICNAHLAQADRLGPLHAYCKELAVLASLAVDFPKVGVPIKIPRNLYPTSFPHWMAKGTKSEIYHSTSVIGVLYDTLKAHLEGGRGSSAAAATPREDPALLLQGREVFAVAARSDLQSWKIALCGLLRQFGVRSAAEVVSGCVLRFHKLNSRDHDAGLKLHKAFEAQRKAFASRFRAHVDAAEARVQGTPDEAHRRHTEELVASAWYEQACSRCSRCMQKAQDSGQGGDGWLCSFPFVVWEVLLRIKCAAHH
eukprot:TRINITY_DN839_c0_g1_i9.p1 TRINITY_DN839_c0_g1~~TRINITY_DN839_c0_g1_i9.p1  ORF type:complete len:1153 (-),score=229.73 TRINITY_DN839_c0_g1_i9:1465-4923(-)